MRPAETAEVAAADPEPHPRRKPLPRCLEMESMSELYEESLRRVQEGEVVKGRIVSITKDYVMVDIGYKSEGQIPIPNSPAPRAKSPPRWGTRWRP